jgi:hypothetical protein
MVNVSVFADPIEGGHEKGFSGLDFSVQEIHHARKYKDMTRFLLLESLAELYLNGCGPNCPSSNHRV